MRQEKRSVNTSGSSSRAAANNSNSQSISKPAVVPFQKKDSQSFHGKENNSFNGSSNTQQMSLNGSGLVVQRTVAEALAYYSEIKETHVESEDEVDFDNMTDREYRTYQRLKKKEGYKESIEPRRKEEQKKKKEQPRGKKRVASETNKPVKKRKTEKSNKKKESGNSQRVGIVTWNIAHFGGGKEGRAFNEKKITEIVNMFKKNNWLDIMVVQEVNDIDLFETLIGRTDLQVLTGGLPMGALKKTGTVGQSEDYAVVTRKSSDWSIISTDSYYPGSGMDVWEESDNMEIGSPVRFNKKAFEKSLAPSLTEKEKDDYVNMTDEQRENGLAPELREYLKELENDFGNEEINFRKDEDVDMEGEYIKWNESHGSRDVWRDRGGNLELKRNIENGNNDILLFIEDLNKRLKTQGFKQFKDVIPEDRTGKGLTNKAYYSQLKTWVNAVIVFLGRLDEQGFANDIKQLNAHLHNVETMIRIEAEEKGTYRPIRRYSINSEERNINLALNVVHTSPSDEGKTADGKKRMKVFSQISSALEDMSKRKNSNEVMIGDLYINPKDLVEKNKKAETVFDEKGVKIAGDTTAATNRWSNKKNKVKYNQADIILVNKDTKVTRGGIVKREKGGLETVDEHHRETDKWTTEQGEQKAFSDHAPVGAIIDLKKRIGVKLQKTATEEMLEGTNREKVEMPGNPFFSLLWSPPKDEK
ncbi:exonuclease/endonuclease/phosphatase family protein [Chitinophaga ginsengisoli]|uniref:Endonuclease/exonuclease/phosphatase family protein n=1 Tax=Chitinophaga ginsengisoli TaxID=363837 RepID=A0A2P8FCX0_9BACT|nr:hypothetical protein [Chitinophaga ginsengisoli]PSL19566.1 hypothetical protein CLV42_12731 [Chitinophaga ginsengisoli]